MAPWTGSIVSTWIARHTCCACGRRDVLAGNSWGGIHGVTLCRTCSTLPPALIKACVDAPWTYALRLRSGDLVLFEGATVHGEWVHLSGVAMHPVAELPGDVDLPNVSISGPMTFERGMDVRINDIAWVSDAPWGS